MNQVFNLRSYVLSPQWNFNRVDLLLIETGEILQYDLYSHQISLLAVTISSMFNHLVHSSVTSTDSTLPSLTLVLSG